MDVLRSRSSRFVATLPTRLYRALPAVILGTLFNILDTGKLLFAPWYLLWRISLAAVAGIVYVYHEVLHTFLVALLALTTPSTLTSQLAMTLGGSRFPGALGAMLIEILPFLRGVATEIRSVLGDDHPGLIPTVMAAYALTSFLTGAAFILLGVLKLGNLVAYFPQTVLTGAIGAIGVSLFVLGLGLPFPPSATPISLSNAGSTLFAKSHLGLLAASFVPAFVLSVTLRSRRIELWTRGLIRSAYYIPVYLLVIPAIFWIAVRAVGFSKEHLIATGWLFTVDATSTSSTAIVATWNYWSLFDFRLVEWWSLKSAIQNIVLLVVIGVLNLPIYVPTLAFTLDVSYDMNHELLGQGAANIFAGVVGTVPNILQYSYSVYVTRANGGRFELSLVIALTTALFFVSGLLLPYVPTILASALVLFIGTELALEAAWEASKTLAWMEYAVVLSTLAGCTFLGFAEGFGVGIGAAALVYLLYGVIDSPARVTRWNEWNELQQVRDQDTDHLAEHPAAPAPVPGRLLSPRSHTPAVIMLDSASGTASATTHEDADVLRHIDACVLTLSGYIFFASVPSLEKALLAPPVPATFFILDVTRAHRIETAAARCLPRCVRELALKGRVLVVCGLAPGSGLHADFGRADIPFLFDPAAAGEGKSILAFATRDACLAWCEREHEKRVALGTKLEGLDDEAKQSAFKSFSRLFNFKLRTVLGPPGGESPEENAPAQEFERFIAAGGRITAYLPGHTISCTGILFVVEGQLNRVAAPEPLDTDQQRPSVQRMLSMLPHQTVRAVRARWSVFSRNQPVHERRLKAGDAFDCRTHSDGVVAEKRSVVVQVEGEELSAWALGKLNEGSRAEAA
ncbi:sulfate transporter family-domain-containing protein [Mycena rosella]|uniref:Sulfate transporter family-domain-containing protein n=1 Tax=Mycena rosella TaxID=1033263 RepID=A0AAD7GT77_MYCRO|nr:sulfate transporter family-domain-containing protein [Mycena rosella]